MSVTDTLQLKVWRWIVATELGRDDAAFESRQQAETHARVMGGTLYALVLLPIAAYAPATLVDAPVCCDD